MSSWANLYLSFSNGMTDYVTRHVQNYTRIQSCLDSLNASMGGSGSSLSFPPGLALLWDRRGIIGLDSYGFSEGTLTGPNYNLTIAAGGYYDATDYFMCSSSTIISMLGKSTDTYYINIDGSGNPTVSDTPTSATTWQFDYDSGTKVVSNKALYTGVAILIDGSEYADMLTSAFHSKTYTQVADRLEYIESLIGNFSQMFGEDTASHSGLDFGFFGGIVHNDNTVWIVTDNTITLTDDDTNYIEVDPADGTVKTNLVGYTADRLPLFTVVTASGAIDTVTDHRTFFRAGGGGGGGGHTQNTDVGSTSDEFLLLMGVTGAPSDNAYFGVERGTSANVFIRWNETEDYWEYTNDGSTWRKLGQPDFDLGAQMLTHFVPKEEPDEVVTDLTRSTSTGWEPVDLSSYMTAPDGVEAVALRVKFWDSTPGDGVFVKFRKGGSTVDPIPANAVWSGEYDPEVIIVPLDSNNEFEFWVEASGVDTANLQVYLLGYYKKVMGVGTQELSFSSTGNVVAGSSAVEFNLTGFLNRGLIHYFKIEETNGLSTDDFDVEVWDTDGFDVKRRYYLTGLLFGQAGDDPFEDDEVWWYKDEDDTSELHIKITNNNASAASFDITILAERFA